MADPAQKTEAAPVSATLTITEMPGGNGVSIDFTLSEPYRAENPSMVQSLAIAALDHMRDYLKSRGSDLEEQLELRHRKPH
ncbi:hypothetical protein [Marinobacter shengliensis]|uniref:hypothetical protein n=1 Tax=Marinobacter shengliensis TaxID=1389223 RepID=UPI00257263CF|nr:hypothetical protein [Marinobacter shengliensis]BEH14292.1 hypothetical protein MAALD49_16600 [Marinobacter shengliensis]